MGWAPQVAHSAGVSSEPEIFELELAQDEHLFLVSASDGLWEFMTSQEVVDLAVKHENVEVHLV